MNWMSVNKNGIPACAIHCSHNINSYEFLFYTMIFMLGRNDIFVVVFVRPSFNVVIAGKLPQAKINTTLQNATRDPVDDRVALEFFRPVLHEKPVLIK
jgi:hypothetical protein